MKIWGEGKNTNAPEHVKGLLSEYFGDGTSPDSSRFADIRCQLLTGTAGTVAATGDVEVFYIAVFRTSTYDERRGLANKRDYDRFVEVAAGKLLMRDGNNFWADKLTVADKRLV